MQRAAGKHFDIFNEETAKFLRMKAILKTTYEDYKVTVFIDLNMWLQIIVYLQQSSLYKNTSEHSIQSYKQ